MNIAEEKEDLGVLMNKLLMRTIGGVGILIILITLTLMGHFTLTVGIGIFSVIAIFEMAKTVKNMGYKIPLFYSIVFDLLIMFAAYLDSSEIYTFIIVISIMLNMTLMLFSKKYSFKDLAISTFLLLYVSVLMSHIIRIRDINYHWILYMIAWGSDVFAYVFGSTFGKHKFENLKKISPNKTIEGSLGGIVGSVVLVLIYSIITNFKVNYLFLIISVAICSIFSQFGDLVASFIKRQAGVKDYGNIIFGHGGIMDRFDSMLFISPIIYYVSVMQGVLW
ncbi:MAG: phosphatidate cytidylyltransferase [Peptoniphilaceae bacterium]|nr:phosphatidate cytidylyltransferase [Peptoniphilaceae bacterium]MDD7382988.1 phosphatidate cytidylyltransferase [Peptoniphilaceae bacterium]MDY3737739.1 phosphatidate cytidylyltransferase [Peptoniphilaceae bacterium]